MWDQSSKLLGLSMFARTSALLSTFEFIWKYFLLNTFVLSHIVKNMDKKVSIIYVAFLPHLVGLETALHNEWAAQSDHSW